LEVFVLVELLINYYLLSVQERELEQAWRLAMKHKKKVCLMVDCIEHVQLLDQFWRTKLEDDGRTQSGYTENDKEEESDAEDGSVDNEASDAPRQKLRERSDEDEETVEVKDVDMRLAVCIDVDVSYQAMGGRLHLGVHRSPIRTTEAFRSVAEAILSTRHLRLAGIMSTPGLLSVQFRFLTLNELIVSTRNRLLIPIIMVYSI
jgi:hypothetical protein